MTGGKGIKSGLGVLGAVAACLILTACGGGGGGGDSSVAATSATTANATITSTGATSTTTTTGSTTTTNADTTGSTTTTTTTTTTTSPPAPAANTATITVDDGPAVLLTGSNPTYTYNSPFVSVTLCPPGNTTNCQTIDHVLVDVGSVGLRIFASVINSNVLSALPNEKDDGGNPVGDCYGFVGGYMFGSVRLADFTIGGETVSGMPFQAIADSGVFSNPPKSCSSGGGTSYQTVQSQDANGIIGLGVTATDCGSYCTGTLTSGSAIYYDCPSSGCGAVVGRSANTSAPFQQLPNPVAAMAVDNNGTLISMPSVSPAGQKTLTGTLYFGIGTQSNNGLGSAKVLSVARSGGGFSSLDVSFFNTDYPYAYIDSGSKAFYFIDNSIAACTTYTIFYCPAVGVPENPTIKATNGVTLQAPFTVTSAQSLFVNANAALPGLSINTTTQTFLNASKSFFFGFGFFYGRNIYTAIEGRNAGGTAGPYFAF